MNFQIGNDFAKILKNLEKLYKENKTSPLLKTPEKDFHAPAWDLMPCLQAWGTRHRSVI